jgi:hypothetical protein
MRGALIYTLQEETGANSLVYVTQRLTLASVNNKQWCQVTKLKCTLPISPFAISPHYNTSCKLVICASLFFYKETPGNEAGI